jgi:release factor glutamine methyltransferase
MVPLVTGPTIGVALRDAAARLGTVSDTPRLDAELLMAHALGTSREAFLLGEMRADAPCTFAGLIARRLAHEPVAHITGRRAFWTIELDVGSDVLVPRPDSETLIEQAVAHFAGTDGPRTILDLGTGSGALLLAALAEWPRAKGVGLDASPAALAVAARNAVALGLADRASFMAGEWEAAGGPADLVLANPPYVESGAALAPELAREPAMALYAGVDGLDAYRRIVPLLPRLIAPGGIACVEIGWTQGDAVRTLVAAAGLMVHTAHDLGGRERCLIAFHA